MVFGGATVAALGFTLLKLKACRDECVRLHERVREWEALWERHESLLEEQSPD